MKFLFTLAAALLLSTSASAFDFKADSSWSWDKIKSARYLKAEFPKIRAGRSVTSITNVCYNAETNTFDTIKPLSVCSGYSKFGPPHKAVKLCTEWVKVHHAFSAVVEKVTCTRWNVETNDNYVAECLETSSIEEERAHTYEVDVLAYDEKRTPQGMMKKVLFTKTYEVPSCF